LSSTLYFSPPANLEETVVVFSPSQGDLLKFFGSVGGFLGLLATIQLLLLGRRLSLFTPGILDTTFFRQHIERHFKRVMPANVSTLFAQSQIKKSDDEESYRIVRQSTLHSDFGTDLFELQPKTSDQHGQ
jgi:hypothetical protein